MKGTDTILNTISGNERKSFNALYNEYQAEMYRYAYNVLRDREQSMDIVQEIFAWIWEHRDEVIITTSLKAYLLAAVKFKTANCIRNGKIRKNFFDQIAAVQPRSSQDGSEELLEVKELEAFIRQAVEALPDKCRNVYELSRKQQLSHREIASELDISVKTVENQMNIALRRLRGVLARMFMY